MDEPKGWLLLDVDGPLNPFRCKSHRPPEGFVSWRLLPGGVWMRGTDARKRYPSRFLRRGFLVRLHPGHGARLQAVADAAGLRLAWATTWQDEANTWIGPAIGLLPLPVVRFADDLLIDGYDRSWSTGSWKYRGVREFAGDRPVAWLDDEFGANSRAAAQAQFLADRRTVPTLLRDVSARTGITDDDLTAVLEWAATL